MKKNILKTKINELSKYLNSESSKDAISVLLRELVDYSEPVIDEGNSNKFILPKEVSSKSNAYALYTDGACRGNPGPGSYAFMVQNYTGDVINEGSGVEKMTTNNKMEMKAIVEGLSYLSSEVSPMHEIFVFTDSKYVVDGMRSWIHGWKKRGWKKADNKPPENIQYWKELDELSNTCHVSFNWIKGHAGHPQNEYVDNLANVALDEKGF